MNIVAFDIDNYGNKFTQFKQLSYPDKLIFFHTHFGIIPFSFPAFDTEISWYSNEAQLELLTENFYKERPRKLIIEKTFTQNGHIVQFNVQPFSPIQRIHYNRFIISAFLQVNGLFSKQFDNDLQTANCQIEFLTLQINKLNYIHEWMRYSIEQSKAKTSLRNQFLQILLNGLTFYYTGKSVTIQQRRKFVEIYLFSQGFFWANYLSNLQERHKEKLKSL